jgi:hypothetical protein
MFVGLRGLGEFPVGSNENVRARKKSKFDCKQRENSVDRAVDAVDVNNVGLDSSDLTEHPPEGAHSPQVSRVVVSRTF